MSIDDLSGLLAFLIPTACAVWIAYQWGRFKGDSDCMDWHVKQAAKWFEHSRRIQKGYGEIIDAYRDDAHRARTLGPWWPQ